MKPPLLPSLSQFDRKGRRNVYVPSAVIVAAIIDSVATRSTLWLWEAAEKKACSTPLFVPFQHW